MGIYIGTQKIDHVYKGTTELSTIRVGEEMTSLIEGDDYERAKWLVGDRNAHIDVSVNIYRDTVNTFLVPLTNSAGVIAYSGTKTIGNDRMEFNTFIGGTNEFTIRHGVRVNNAATAVVAQFQNNYIGENFVISTYRDGNNYCGIINGTTHSIAHGDIQSADTDITVQIILQDFKLGYFSIPTNFSLIPCRLLHAIPSTFDANGIARNADECGMYDSVNGLFYGNVAGSGSFSVSND